MVGGEWGHGLGFGGGRWSCPCCLLACARQVGMDLLWLYPLCDAVEGTRNGHTNIMLGRETRFLTPKPNPCPTLSPKWDLHL